MTVLVLDLDGVVVTGHPDGGRWDRHLMRDLGLAPEIVQERFFRAHWPRIEIGAADLHAVLGDIWPTLGTSGCDAAGFVAYWFAHDSRLDLEVLGMVDAWRREGGQAYLATVQEHHRARHVWADLGLKNHFDGMVYSAELGAKKPQDAFYARALERLPVSAPGDILFLDDRAENVAAARRAGWQAHLYKRPDDLRRALAGG